MSDIRETLAKVPESIRRAALESLTPAELLVLQHDWRIWGRREQQMPEGDWFVWLILSGRGWGKTETGSQTVQQLVESGRHAQICAAGPTAASVRRDMVEGPSGVLAIARPDFRPVYEPSSMRVVYPNGAKVNLGSGEEPDRFRGQNNSFAWIDEFAAFAKPQETLDMILLSLRVPGPKGESPRLLVTTTPRPIPALKQLLTTPNIVITRGHTADNAANLDPAALAALKARYEGTRLGRQELSGELLTDVPGALWTEEMLAASRVQLHQVPELARVIVGVDPSGSSRLANAETGIVVVGKCRRGEFYVLRDYSGHLTPEQWGRRTIDAFQFESADKIVAERNYGGDMVEGTLRSINPSVPVKMVTATRGKAVRAEPIASLFEQGRAHIVGSLETLERQLCDWSPSEGGPSPDRLDAMVWAAMELLLTEEPRPARWISLPGLFAR
jgi:phage terminase large subunit-like protein